MTPQRDATRVFSGWRRHLLIAAGSISLALGVIGMALPVMPTTPFLLLAAACYLRSSRRLYDWMHSNRLFGFYMRQYSSGEGVPLAVKLFTIISLWTAMLLSGFLFVPGRLWWVRVILFTIGALVTVHVLRQKTAPGRKR